MCLFNKAKVSCLSCYHFTFSLKIKIYENCFESDTHLINGDFSDDLVSMFFSECLDLFLKDRDLFGHHLPEVRGIGRGESTGDGRIALKEK